MDERVTAAAKERGLSTPSAYLRLAVENELRGRDKESVSSQEPVAASIDRLSTEVFRMVRGQQALFAFLDSLIKVLLTCIPEPAGDAVEPAVAKGRLRYDRLIKAASRSMSGDAKAAMEDLVANGQE